MRLLLVAGVAAVTLAAVPRTPSAPDAAALHEQGRAIYNFRCYFCHGYSGDAQTVAAGMLADRPAAFSALGPDQLTRDRIVSALQHGRPGTAMASFNGILAPQQMQAVAAFVFEEFVIGRRRNTRYHTPENGWPDHERFGAAFRFVRDPAALSLPVEQLEPAEARGRQLYLTACISCHDAPTRHDAAAWEARPVSYPADGHDCVSCHDRVRYPERGLERLPPPASYHAAAGLPPAVRNAESASVSPYARHDVPVDLADASPEQLRGETLYMKNCAFCHAADGTAKHWIGRFLEPHPRDLTDAAFRASMSRDRLIQRIEDGLPGTAMPTWRNVLNRDEIGAVAAYLERAFGPLGGSAGR